MAHYTPIAGFKDFTGALSKKKIQGVDRMTVMRRKRIKDPLTGETLALGPKEIYSQYLRDYERHPMTEKEQTQRTKWREACKAAAVIIRDKSHPRYMEFYHRWREHVSIAEKPMQFPNFIRAELAKEGG